jgi:Holliday junction resolvase-like predicted endonuclease
MNNFNSANAADGRRFEQSVAYHLQSRGWTVTAGLCHNGVKELRHGIEIDIVAIDPDDVLHTIECKGSASDGNRAGGRRTDTIKKAIADAWYLKASGSTDPHILFASHLPTSGVALDQLRMALERGLFASARTPWGEIMDGSTDEWVGNWRVTHTTKHQIGGAA